MSLEDKCMSTKTALVDEGRCREVILIPLLRLSSWCPGGVGEHVALQHQRRLLPVDEAEKRGSGRGTVQTGSTTARPRHPEPSVR